MWLSHRALTHLVVTHPAPCELPKVIEDDLGPLAGLTVNILYLVFYLGMVVAYATGMINIAATYIDYQMGMEAIPRPVLSLLIALGVTAIMLAAGERTLLRITSAVVFPLIFALLFLSIYLVPLWDSSILMTIPKGHDLVKSLLLITPILIFSMDFSPVCAMLAISYRKHYPDARMAMRHSDRAVYWNSLLLLVFLLFFVLSCVLATRPQDLLFARVHNIDVLTLLSLAMHPTILRMAFPLLAFATILHSYFVVFLGARAGVVTLLDRIKHQRSHPDGQHTLEWIATLLIALPLWLLAFADPSILAIMGMLAAPIVALVCYAMPVYVFRRIPRLSIYRDRASTLVLATGIFIMCSYFIGTWI